jgi:hypothetical protein
MTKNLSLSTNKILISVLIFLLIIILIMLGFLIIKKNNFQKSIRIQQLKTDESLVIVNSNSFSPNKKEIAVKKITIFRNTDKIPLSITSTYPRFKTHEINPESEFSFVFLIPGVWTINLTDDKNVKVIINVR